MSLLLTNFLTSPMLAGVVGTSFAVALLALLMALAVYAGLYYSVPRMLVKWLTRRAFVSLG